MARGTKRNIAEAGSSSAPVAKQSKDVLNRRRAPAMEEQARPEVAEEIAVEGAAEAEGQGQAPNRREGMADVARRRAAHFALFQDDESDAVNNVHTGGTEARNLGPWSSAYELVNARAAALEAREGRISGAARAGLASLADDSIAWTPKRDPEVGPRPESTVNSLFQGCLELLVEHIEDVETLWGMPDLIKVKLAAALCQARKLSPDTAKLMCDDAPDEVVITDCTQMNEEEAISVFAPAFSPGLERLELDMCGRGFGDSAVAALCSAAAGQLPALRVLSLGGAYRLSDDGLLTLLRAAPGLQELHLAQCCRIEGTALQQLPSLTKGLKVLDLADCRGLGADSLRRILCGDANLGLLEGLVLDGVGEVDDQLLTEICLSLPKLSRLSIKFCSLVSDVGLRGIAAGCGHRLSDLGIDEITKVTDQGVVALAEACINLQVFSLQRCHQVTDVGIASISSTGQLRILNVNKLHKLGVLAVKALIATCSEKLEELDISWCRGIPNKALGLLVDSCPALRKITIFGCSQIDKTFLFGHSSALVEVIGATEQRSGPPAFAKLRLAAGDYVEDAKD